MRHIVFADIRCVLFASACVRVILYMYSVYHDSHYLVKFTDVDYSVYNDAAQIIYNDKYDSPYNRATYRYTPLLAYLMLPNLLLSPAVGKLIFSAADLITGYLLYKLSFLIYNNKSTAAAITAGFLFNPLTITLSIRGNADILISLLIFLSILALFNKYYNLSAIILGLAIHFKIYPIIYGPAILLFINRHYVPSQLVNSIRLQYFLLSGGTFFMLGALFYSLYGSEFLYQTYFYHIIRSDTRHNFSVYFYSLYLQSSAVLESSVLTALLAFLPQFLPIMYIIYRFHDDLLFTLFIITWIFVAFNKVITAQYFIWFFSLFPIILPRVKLGYTTILILLLLWLSCELHWLYWGYNIEFLGLASFNPMFLAAALFFISNIILIIYWIKSYQLTPVFVNGQINTSASSSGGSKSNVD
jgi:phosphatidylinositol glycan class M